MASRGCPYQCTYCCNNVYVDLYKGQKTVRFQSAKYVVEQLKYFKEKYDFARVDFMDDVLAATTDRLEELLPPFKKEIDVPFSCFMYPNRFTIQDEVVKILKENGCEWMKVGSQSASESYRRQVLKRKESNASIIQLSDMCNKYGLAFSLDHILNMPGETEENMVDAIRLYQRCQPIIINFGGLIYLPKTDIVDTGLEQGVLTQEDVDMINRGLEPNALKGNLERYKGDSTDINYSMFALFFILVTILPKSFINFLVDRKLYASKFEVPTPVMVFFKVISKIKAKQVYLYFGALKYSVFYFLKLKLGSITAPFASRRKSLLGKDKDDGLPRFINS